MKKRADKSGINHSPSPRKASSARGIASGPVVATGKVPARLLTTQTSTAMQVHSAVATTNGLTIPTLRNSKAHPSPTPAASSDESAPEIPRKVREAVTVWAARLQTPISGNAHRMDEAFTKQRRHQIESKPDEEKSSCFAAKAVRPPNPSPLVAQTLRAASRANAGRRNHCGPRSWRTM